MALAYTAAIQNDIAYRLRGSAYSNLSANEKAGLDGTWSSGALTSGYALAALTQIQQYGQWFGLTVPTSAPVEWEQWLIARTVMNAGQQMRPDRCDEYRIQHEQAESAAIDAYGRNSITYDPGSTPEQATLTVQNIRYYVTYHCARKQRWETVEGSRRVRPRMWVSPEMVDAQIERVLRNLWNRAEWSFKRRQVNITISTASAVSMDLTGSEVFHSIASREFYYQDVPSFGAYTLQWAKDGTVFSRLQAFKVASTLTGRPRFFRIENKSDTLTWIFDCTPDQQYIVSGEVNVKGPSLTTLTATTTAMARFPVEFDHVIKDAVLAETLTHLGDPDGDKLKVAIETEIARLLPIFSQTAGNAQSDQGVRDVYNDIGLISNANMYYGPMWAGYNRGELGGGL